MVFNISPSASQLDDMNKIKFYNSCIFFMYGQRKKLDKEGPVKGQPNVSTAEA